jgi:hypothetical protein
MKVPFLYALCLLLVCITLLAGCSSSPSGPGTITPSSGQVPAAAGTPLPFNEVLQMFLSPAELPFVAADIRNQTLDMRGPTFSPFGAIRGFTQFSSNEKAESATSVTLGQMIVEYPPGNATQAFLQFKNTNLNAPQSQYETTWLDDPRIGDQSCALQVVDRTGKTKTVVMVVFTKSNIMESVVMAAPSPDIDALTRTARLAAAKIPSP